MTDYSLTSYAPSPYAHTLPSVRLHKCDCSGRIYPYKSEAGAMVAS